MQFTVPYSEFPGTSPSISPVHRRAFDGVIAAAVTGLQGDGFRPVYTSTDRPREVARLIGHALRIGLLTGPAESIPLWAYGRPPGLGLLDDAVAEALDQWRSGPRRAVGMSLISGLRGSASDPAARPVRLLGNWLIGQNPPAAAAGMAQWISHRLRSHRNDLGLAWWRIHGDQLIPLLGREPRLLERAVTQRWAAGGTSVDRLAELAELPPDQVQGILRPRPATV
ncbi:hypothetical protein ACWDSJ_27720 [Nocardia sp. NPDC003482]